MGMPSVGRADGVACPMNLELSDTAGVACVADPALDGVRALWRIFVRSSSALGLGAAMIVVGVCATLAVVEVGTAWAALEVGTAWAAAEVGAASAAFALLRL
jgi:hypothetical protein